MSKKYNIIDKILIPTILLVLMILIYFLGLFGKETVVDGSYTLLIPKISVFGIMILSMSLLIKGVYEYNKSDYKIDLKEISIDNLTKNKILLFKVTVLSFLYITSFMIFGFLLVTPFFLFVFSYLLMNKKIITGIVVSLFLTLIIYILFIKVLYIPLPQGVWIFKMINEIFMY